MSIIAHTPPCLQGYDFVRPIGIGATATVYLYNQHVPTRPVAVKISSKASDPSTIALFRQESDATAKLSAHPYILPMYDAGITDDGHSYMILEYASGGTYETLMRARSLTCEQVLDLGVKLAGALCTAHRNNVIHHDIKPSNILITKQGTPALSDFGISTNAYDHIETGCSPPWAPPEVLQHLSNGAETADIYSLGATLYALLAGCSPYEYTYQPRTQSELVHLILSQPLPRMSHLNVPADIEQILSKSLEKNPDRRYYSALEFARDIQHAQYILFGRTTPITVEGVPPYPTEIVRLHRPRAPDNQTARPQRQWIIPVIIATGVAVTAITICLVFVVVILPRMDSITGSTTIQVSLSYANCNEAARYGKDSGRNHG